MLIAKEFMVDNYAVEAWDKVIYIYPKYNKHWLPWHLELSVCMYMFSLCGQN